MLRPFCQSCDTVRLALSKRVRVFTGARDHLVHNCVTIAPRYVTRSGLQGIVSIELCTEDTVGLFSIHVKCNNARSIDKECKDNARAHNISVCLAVGWVGHLHLCDVFFTQAAPVRLSE